MRKLVSMAILLLMFSVSSVQASTYNFTDDLVYWPTWPSPIASQNTMDTLGTPDIWDVTVEVNANILSSVTVHMSHPPDYYGGHRLFIDPNGGDWAWEYYAQDVTMYKMREPVSLFSGGPSADQYLVGNGRSGHPYGVKPTWFESGQVMSPYPIWSQVDKTYTYDLESLALSLDDEWAIGFTVACANDVFIGFQKGRVDPVPEPATMLLLGSGLLGIVGLRKRIHSR